jgi:competence ComEA-like helix-hairpin-helix protein
MFLAALLSLGAGARFVSAARNQQLAHSQPRDGSRLAAQIAAVDSEKSRQRQARQSRSSKTPRARPSKRAVKHAAVKQTDSAIIVDVDHASAEELELLPRVGPALAKRIVSDRDEHGPFGSLEGLTRVKGIGPKLVTHIAKHVTFSGSARPSTALSVSPGASHFGGRPPPPG